MLEFDEDEMAVLEGQRLVADLFPDSGYEPNFEGFHASEGVTGRLSDVAAAAAYRTNPNLPD